MTKSKAHFFTTPNPKQKSNVPAVNRYVAFKLQLLNSYNSLLATTSTATPIND